MNWHHNDSVVEQLPNNTYGFIYKLTLIKDGNTFYYIGMKQTSAMKTLPALKSGEQRPNSERIRKQVMLDSDGKVVRSKPKIRALRSQGHKATIQNFDRLIVESDWQSYEGSSTNTEGHELIHKEILDFIPNAKLSKKWMSYMENYRLYINEVLLDPNYLNDNISGKYFRSDFIKEQ